MSPRDLSSVGMQPVTKGKIIVDNTPRERPRVVIIGGGFGGLHAVRALRRVSVDVTLVDKRNLHLFQPLLYQVASGELPPAIIWQFTGLLASLIWLFVHHKQLVRFENRVLVFLQWAWSYIARRRSARLITQTPERYHTD